MICIACRRKKDKKECIRCNKIVTHCPDCLLSQMKHYYQSFLENVLSYDQSEENVKMEKELKNNILKFDRDRNICWYCI